MTIIDVTHHKFIATLLILLVFITGVFLGVKISGSAGPEGMLVLLFAFMFLSIVMLFLIYIQVMHLREGRRKK